MCKWTFLNRGFRPDQDTLCQLDRKQQTVNFRLRTGHCGLRARLKRIGQADTATWTGHFGKWRSNARANAPSLPTLSRPKEGCLARQGGPRNQAMGDRRQPPPDNPIHDTCRAIQIWLWPVELSKRRRMCKFSEQGGEGVTFWLPHWRKKFQGQHTFSYIGPVTWNSLPFAVHHAQTLPSFKSQLKTGLFCQSK